MQSIEYKILVNMKKRGRGKEFFASDFSAYGESKSVSKALSNLVKKQVLIKLATGIYYYPKIDKKLGLGILYPSLDTVAEAIAKRDKARIVPTGIYALNRLGLSTQVPANYVYLTDGSPRRIKVGNGKGILLKHTAPKNLAFKNDLAMLITFALKEITQERVTQEHLDRLKYVLQQVPKEHILQDSKLMPAWIKKLILKLYE
ncbi:hypothetical protein AGMMS49574_27590 [Bacteroidia bacterium]|nr:hypothetical protein AGMMS49574_27590 [Bacteroidia bacterium]GHU57617.1 hypothetical protein FACS189411_11650 [Bacteroidia bacterium]